MHGILASLAAVLVSSRNAPSGGKILSQVKTIKVNAKICVACVAGAISPTPFDACYVGFDMW